MEDGDNERRDAHARQYSLINFNKYMKTNRVQLVDKNLLRYQYHQ